MEVSRVAFRIHKELVKPLRELDITDKEFTCLRTIVFFAPGQSLNTSSVLCRHKHGFCQEHLASFFQSVQTTWFHNGRWEHINVGLLWFFWQINSCVSFEPSNLLIQPDQMDLRNWTAKLTLDNDKTLDLIQRQCWSMHFACACCS